MRIDTDLYELVEGRPDAASMLVWAASLLGLNDVPESEEVEAAIGIFEDAREQIIEKRAKDRLTDIVRYIVPPQYDKKWDKRTSKHPDIPRNWWNGAFVKSFGWTKDSFIVEVSSYVGNNEYDGTTIEIPQHLADVKNFNWNLQDKIPLIDAFLKAANR
ncbi:hypothetical protein [Xanthomonas phage X1]|nr:hypothetical protein [Xanthomonas phage X1]